MTEVGGPSAGPEAGHLLQFLPPPPDEYGCASNKALQLLRMALPDALWSELVKSGIIQFTGQRANYLISCHSRTKVYDRTTGQCLAYSCVQLSIEAPDYDRMLAEYLMLKNDEDCYWQKANIFRPASDVALLFVGALDVCLLAYVVRSLLM